MHYYYFFLCYRLKEGWVVGMAKLKSNYKNKPFPAPTRLIFASKAMTFICYLGGWNSLFLFSNHHPRNKGLICTLYLPSALEQYRSMTGYGRDAHDLRLGIENNKANQLSREKLVTLV